MNRSWTVLHKKELIAEWGDRCIMCTKNAPKQKVEWHHIVELADGGENTIENVIPLCHKHHMMVHHTPKRARVYKDFNAGGRPRLKLDDGVLTKYIHAEIDMNTAHSLLGLGRTTKISDLKEYKSFLKKKGICSIERLAYHAIIYFSDGHIETWNRGYKVACFNTDDDFIDTDGMRPQES